MYNLYPYVTNDGSIGLFSPKSEDIYHSAQGALTEAYEKFVLPCNLENFSKSEIKILDICYGIGYNTKSFLNKILELNTNQKFLTKNNCLESIGTNNIKYSDSIYTDNRISKIFIHAIDNDKNLALLSPFFKNKNKKEKLNFNNDKIKKYLTDKFLTKYILKDEINYILFEKLKNRIDDEVISLLFNKKYHKYFDPFLCNYIKTLQIQRYKNTNLSNLITFLHNIYYLYISNSYKKAANALKLHDFNFQLSLDDARSIIICDKNIYDFIFLDAFTPTKCPCLWTFDFFKQLFNHLDSDGMILTYSNSAQVRNAFLNAGFFVGKNIIDGKSVGTIATKNKSLIKTQLSEFDLGLLKTNAGIFYRDENLTLANDEILKQHNFEVKNSTLMSSTKYIKNYKSK